MRKTNKDFGAALDELRIENDLSYDRLSLQIGMTASYLYSIINRRIASAPKDEVIKKIADYFGVSPEYFFEYRLRKFIKFVEDNRDYLDHCEKEKNKWLNKKEAQETEFKQATPKAG